MLGLEIRQEKIEDSALIHRFITELAAYEKAEGEVLAAVADIENSLFDAQATTYAVICSLNNEPIGFAVYFFNFSTWLGRHGACRAFFYAGGTAVAASSVSMKARATASRYST